MPENKIELHLRTNQGTSKEKIYTVYVDQETMREIEDLKKTGLTLEQAYLKTLD